MRLQDELKDAYRIAGEETITPSEEVWRRLDRLRDLLSADLFLHSEETQLIITTKTEKRPVILRKRNLIGTAPAADIVLVCPYVSHEHCEITPEAGQMTIRDLGSTNGTFVNAERITECVLRDGDIIQVGTVTMVYLVGHDNGT